MRLSGFQAGDSGAGAEAATVDLVLTELAKLHALSYDFIKRTSDDSYKVRFSTLREYDRSSSLGSG